MTGASGGKSSGGPEGGAVGAAAVVGMVAMAAMATYSASISSHVMPALGVEGVSTDSCKQIRSSPTQRAQTLAQNQKVEMPSDALDGQGLITDPSKLGEYTMFQQPVSSAGGGAVAAYNAMKQLAPQSAPSFPQVIFDIEAYGAVETPNGMFTPGLSDYLAKQGCGVEFTLPGEAAPAGRGAAVGLSLEQGVMSYHTLSPDQCVGSFCLVVTPND